MSQKFNNVRPMYQNPKTEAQREVNRWSEIVADKIPGAFVYGIHSDDHRWEQIYLHAYQALASLPEDHIETLAIIEFINEAHTSSSTTRMSPFNKPYTVTMQLLKDGKLEPGTALYLEPTANRVADGEQAGRITIKGPLVYEKTRQPVMLPVFAEDLPVRDPVALMKMNMVRKAFKLAHRRMHCITHGIVPVTASGVALVTDIGLYGYLALASMRPDEPEAEEIITMLHNLYCELAEKGSKQEYRHTPTMYRLWREDEKFTNDTVRLREGDVLTAPIEPLTAKSENIFLTCSTTLPLSVQEELQAVLERHYTGSRATVLDYQTRNLVKRPVSVVVEYAEQGVYQAKFHTLGGSLDETAMRFIIANLKEADSKTSTYTLDGPNVLLIHIDLVSIHNSADIRELIRVAIQNNIIHSLLTVSEDRYTNEITFKSRK